MYNFFPERNKPNCRSIFSSLLLSSATVLLISTQALAYEIDPDATISDSPATLMGVNHIGLSVRDLDASLDFYQRASGFKAVSYTHLRAHET